MAKARVPRFLPLVIAILLVGCAGAPPTLPLKAYDGPERSEAELAVLTCGPYCLAIGDRTVGGKDEASMVEARLVPGTYRVRFGCWLFSFDWFDPDVWQERSAEVTLEAGTNYRAEAECGYYARAALSGRVVASAPNYFWIENQGSGELIYGAKPPPKK